MANIQLNACAGVHKRKYIADAPEAIEIKFSVNGRYQWRDNLDNIARQPHM